MEIKKFGEIGKIKKIDFSLEDMKDFEGWQSFSNAHYLMSNFYKSGDQNRISNNPHGITYERISKVFGEPNFQDEYNESNWWILEYKSEKYAVDVNSHEGSGISKFVPNSVDGSLMYDKKFNQDAQEFYTELFKLI